MTQWLILYGLTSFERLALLSILGISILGILYAFFLRRQILQEDRGDKKMQEVWGAISEGADAYLRRQLVTVLPLILILTVALFFSVYIVPPSAEAAERFKEF